jgi:hypothetical protein
VTVLRKITIISGGQTGADRAALDFALANGLEHGGWCPRNRRAEDGPIPLKYQLRETPSTHYAQRTEWNVRDSDATLVFSVATKLKGGTRLTFELAKQMNKPVLHLSRTDGNVDSAAARLIAFVSAHTVRIVNVAGPRASQEPKIGTFVAVVLEAALGGR